MNHFTSSISDDFHAVLLDILADSAELQRVTKEISETTLRRWLHGAHKPQVTKLYRLLKLVSPERQKQLQSIVEALTDFPTSAVLLEYGIPSTVYARALSIITDNSPSLWWAICDLALNQAIKHIDRDRIGVQISLARCIPEKNGTVTALREELVYGTGMWDSYEECRGIFYGAESLLGKALATFRVVVGFDQIEEQHWSAAAIPVLKGGRCVGCVYVKSVQDVFFTSAMCDLIQQYVALCSLAFQLQESFERESIALIVLPSAADQLPLLAHFDERKNELMRQNGLGAGEASLIVTRQIVTELRLLPPVSN